MRLPGKDGAHSGGLCVRRWSRAHREAAPWAACVAADLQPWVSGALCLSSERWRPGGNMENAIQNQVAAASSGMLNLETVHKNGYQYMEVAYHIDPDGCINLGKFSNSPD